MLQLLFIINYNNGTEIYFTILRHSLNIFLLIIDIFLEMYDQCHLNIWKK